MSYLDTNKHSNIAENINWVLSELPVGEHNKSTSRKKKIVTPNAIKKVLYAGPKYFDKLKPKSGPIRKARPDLQLCTMSKVSFWEFYCTCITTRKYLRLNQNAQRWIGKKVPSFTFNSNRMSNKTRCDVLVKQIFRTWMKTLLHCGFG